MKLMSGMQEQFEEGKPLEQNPIGVLLPETFEEARILCSVIHITFYNFGNKIDKQVLDLYKMAANSKTLSEMKHLILKADDLLINHRQVCTDGSHNWGLREFLDLPPAGNYGVGSIV